MTHDPREVPQITMADIRKHTGEGMVSEQNVIDAANEVLKEIYTSPPPAAGWNDNQLQLIIERALLDDEYFGNRAADEDQLEAQARGSAALIVESLRRTAPTPEGVVSVELLNIERATGDRLRSENDKLRATIASPGEQEPVAHRIRVVDGSYCKVIPDGELEIWKQNWSTHLKSGHALLEPLYLSPPPAEGWDEEYPFDDERFNKGVQHVVDLIARELGVTDWIAGDGSEDYDCDLWQTILNILSAKGLYDKDEGEFKALRREAPAPEGVADTAREQWVTDNADGSISLDAYAGWSREALKERCQELISQISDWQWHAVDAATSGGNKIENVPELARIQIQRMIDAHSDDDTPSHPDAGGGVRVKPLVWRDHRPDAFPEPAWSAKTPFGFYNIEEVSASDSPAYVVRLHAHHFVADKDSLEGAKAAAQADYEQRVLSALSNPPAAVEINASAESDGTMCPHPIETLWRKVGLPEFFLGNGGTNHKLYDLYDAIRSTESNASAEARLREALEHYAKEYCEGWCEQDAGCANFDHDCGGCLARRALSAVGDEAKKSDEAGIRVEDNPRSHGESLQQGPDTSSNPSTAAPSHGKGSDAAYVANPVASPDLLVSREAPASSDPTAERREIVALADIAAERKRQIEAEGWTVGHDDRHTDGALAKAATCYASVYPLAASYWPWDIKWWKPKDRRRDLVRAGALIVAEIERLDRLAALDGGVCASRAQPEDARKKGE